MKENSILYIRIDHSIQMAEVCFRRIEKLAFPTSAPMVTPPEVYFIITCKQIYTHTFNFDFIPIRFHTYTSHARLNVLYIHTRKNLCMSSNYNNRIQ